MKFNMTGLIVCFLLSACSAVENNSQAEAPTPLSKAEVGANVTESMVNHSVIKKTDKPKPACGFSPPIRDMDKIRTMLINADEIDPTLSREQQERLVREYINKKQRILHKKCR